MAAQPNDSDVERIVLENNLVTAADLAQFKAELSGQPLYPALVQQGVIPYDLQVQLEQAAQAAPEVRPGGLPGSTLRPRTGPVPVLGVPPPKLGAPPAATPLVAPPSSGSGRMTSMPKPPALSGLAAAPAPMVPPPAGLVPPPKMPGGSFIPPPKLPGGMIPPPKLPGGIPSKLPGGPVVPAPRVSITPAVPKPAVPAAAVPAPAPVHAAPAPAAHAAPPPEPPKAHDHGGHGHGGGAAEPKIPEGWPNGIAPMDNSPNGLQAMMKKARQMGASDLHLSVGLPPMIRIHGDLQKFDPAAAPMSSEETLRHIRSALTPAQWAFFDRGGDLDMSYAFPDGGRYRTNIVRERNGDGLICRIIGEKIFTPEELGLPTNARRLTEFAQGLVLVTGPSGHGKTTTMMALVELVNANRPDHIITVEEPIEYIIEGKKCHVSQREVGPHTLSFANALRAALRENPDIIVIGELRDYETTSMSINAAETGHLVFASLPTQDAAKTIDKVLDYFPPEEQTQIRLMVSESLRGILSQQLVKRKDGSGRVAAVELLFNSVAVANIIRDANTAGLINAMQLGKNAGMVLMDDSLLDLVNKGIIAGEEAYYRATNKVKFKQFEPKADAAPKAPAAAQGAAPGARPGLPGKR